MNAATPPQHALHARINTYITKHAIIYVQMDTMG